MWMFDCMFACVFRIHRHERKERMNSTERERTKMGGGGWKMQVVYACGSVHLKYINITWTAPQLWETKVTLCGEKNRKHIGTKERSSIVFSVWCRFAFMSEGRKALVMYCGFFTSGWLKLRFSICGFLPRFSLSLLSLCSSMVKKLFEGPKKKKEGVPACARKKEMYTVGEHSSCG